MHSAAAASPVLGALTSLGGIIDNLEHPALALVRTTLLRPFQIGASVTAAWAMTRNLAMGLVLVVFLYGIVRAQVGPLIGLPSSSPWLLVPRMVFTLPSIALSLPLVRGLLTLNNLACAALQSVGPAGSSDLIRPLEGGLLAGLAPTLLGIASDAVGVAVLVGLGMLACSYLIRAAEIALLTLLLPLAMALWLVPAAAGAYRAVFGHLIVAIFVQTVQQTVLLVVAHGLGGSMPAAGFGWLWAFAAMTLLFRCRGLLSSAVQAASDWVPPPDRVFGALMPGGPGIGRALGRLWPAVSRVSGIAG